MKRKDECRHLKTRVVDSRAAVGGTRRRRLCLDCGHRYSTIECVIRPRKSTDRRSVLPVGGEHTRAIKRMVAMQLRRVANQVEAMDAAQALRELLQIEAAKR